jgi:hypothetical protein
MVKSDVLDRGIPWTQLILRYGQFGSDLNVRTTYRLSVMAAYLTVMLGIAGTIDLTFLWLALVPMMLLGYWGRDYYRFFFDQRGIGFAARVVPIHFLNHLYNGVSFIAGTILFMMARRNLQLPGALPAHAPVGGQHATSLSTAAAVGVGGPTVASDH